MCSNPCEPEVTCFRPESNRRPYGLLNFLSAALSTTELWWRMNHRKSFRTLFTRFISALVVRVFSLAALVNFVYKLISYSSRDPRNKTACALICVSFSIPKTDFYVYTSFSPNVYVVNTHMCVCAYTFRSRLHRMCMLCIHVCMCVRIVYTRVCVCERIHMEAFFPVFKHGDGGQLLETPWSISYYIYRGEKVWGIWRICPLIIERRHSKASTRKYTRTHANTHAHTRRYSEVWGGYDW